jgi:hypothetical protein
MEILTIYIHNNFERQMKSNVKLQNEIKYYCISKNVFLIRKRTDLIYMIPHPVGLKSTRLLIFLLLSFLIFLFKQNSKLILSNYII